MPIAALAKPNDVSSGLVPTASCWKLSVPNALLPDLLGLVAVRVVEAGLDRVAAHDLGQADRDVLGRVDVEPAGEPDASAARSATRLPH